MPPFSEQLLEMLICNIDGEGNMTSLPLKALRNFVVIPGTASSDVSTVPRARLASGEIPALRVAVRGLWAPGDFCTSLAVHDALQEVLALVHHQSNPGRFDQRLELVSIPYTMSHQHDHCTIRWPSSRKVAVFRFRLHGQSFEKPLRTIPYRTPKSKAVPPVGRLKNGMLYFVDHILLYSDGFSQYSFKQGSAGGIYCISLNYPPNLRRSRDSVRVLGLTPPGVSTKEGLRPIIPDLVKCSTSGIVTRSAGSEDVVIFIDVAYVCDYHEIGHVLDVVGPNGSAPCHLCSFLRFKGPQTSATKYANTLIPNSADGCYARTSARTSAIRSGNMTDDELVALGLNTREAAEVKGSPPVEFQESLKKALEKTAIPKTEADIPVVNPVFDPYRSVVVAPDHLLAGIAINELTLAFKSLPNGWRRKQVEQIVSQMLLWNGLIHETRIFNHKDSYLYTTSISSTFCTLFVAAPVFTELVEDLCSPQEISSHDHNFLRTIISNLCLFRKLVAWTYWYPTSGVDDPLSVKAFNDNDGMTRIAGLQDLCIEYMTKCNEICKKSTLATKKLDKPNLHRLLELYMHSIPAMGHVRHFAELVFECAHQPLKRAMANSNKQPSHLQAMKSSLVDDWKRRLSAALNDTDGVNDAKDSRQSVLNLFCGCDAHAMRRIEDQPEAESSTSELVRNEVLKTIIGPAPVHMDRRAAVAKWVLSEPDDHHHPVYFARIKRMCEDYILEAGTKPPKFYFKARNLTLWGSGSSQAASQARPYKTMSRGKAVQCLVVDESSVLVHLFSRDYDQDTSKASLSYFTIEKLFTIGSAATFAAVRRCSVLEGKNTCGSPQTVTDP